MVSITQINNLINDLENEVTPQSVEYTFIHNEKLDTLFWYKNCNQLRTDEEVKNKIKRYTEECILLNEHDLFYRGKQERIKILKSLLS